MASVAQTELSEEAGSVISLAHSVPRGCNRRREAVHIAHKMLPSCSPRLTLAMCLSHKIPLVGRESDPMEVTKMMPPQARHDTHEVLYSLIAGAEGCGSAARSARLAQDKELAEFLSRVQEEVLEEAKRLLAQRVAE
jgi:hypothetical protein